MDIGSPWINVGVCRDMYGVCCRGTNGNFRNRGKSDPSDSIARTGIASSKAICCTITMYILVSSMEIINMCILCIFVYQIGNPKRVPELG